ncbi:hypothetical protein, partial [Helicobacter sp. 13S00401-1]|uniref:beta strand repeat-containing protein n=1 Tax=Helicobacter sp. 13S00401-1 TaxID=1905758 RepID=UPI00117AB516
MLHRFNTKYTGVTKLVALSFVLSSLLGTIYADTTPQNAGSKFNGSTGFTRANSVNGGYLYQSRNPNLTVNSFTPSSTYYLKDINYSMNSDLNKTNMLTVNLAGSSLILGADAATNGNTGNVLLGAFSGSTTKYNTGVTFTGAKDFYIRGNTYFGGNYAQHGASIYGGGGAQVSINATGTVHQDGVLSLIQCTTSGCQSNPTSLTITGASAFNSTGTINTSGGTKIDASNSDVILNTLNALDSVTINGKSITINTLNYSDIGRAGASAHATLTATSGDVKINNNLQIGNNDSLKVSATNLTTKDISIGRGLQGSSIDLSGVTGTTKLGNLTLGNSGGDSATMTFTAGGKSFEAKNITSLNSPTSQTVIDLSKVSDSVKAGVINLGGKNTFTVGAKNFSATSLETGSGSKLDFSKVTDSFSLTNLTLGLNTSLDLSQVTGDTKITNLSFSPAIAGTTTGSTSALKAPKSNVTVDSVSLSNTAFGSRDSIEGKDIKVGSIEYKVAGVSGSELELALKGSKAVSIDKPVALVSWNKLSASGINLTTSDLSTQIASQLDFSGISGTVKMGSVLLGSSSTLVVGGEANKVTTFTAGDISSRGGALGNVVDLSNVTDSATVGNVALGDSATFTVGSKNFTATSLSAGLNSKLDLSKVSNNLAITNVALGLNSNLDFSGVKGTTHITNLNLNPSIVNVTLGSTTTINAKNSDVTINNIKASNTTAGAKTNILGKSITVDTLDYAGTRGSDGNTIIPDGAAGSILSINLQGSNDIKVTKAITLHGYNELKASGKTLETNDITTGANSFLSFGDVTDGVKLGNLNLGDFNTLTIGAKELASGAISVGNGTTLNFQHITDSSQVGALSFRGGGTINAPGIDINLTSVNLSNLQKLTVKAKNFYADTINAAGLDSAGALVSNSTLELSGVTGNSTIKTLGLKTASVYGSNFDIGSLTVQRNNNTCINGGCNNNTVFYSQLDKVNIDNLYLYQGTSGVDRAGLEFRGNGTTKEGSSINLNNATLDSWSVLNVKNVASVNANNLTLLFASAYLPTLNANNLTFQDGNSDLHVTGDINIYNTLHLENLYAQTYKAP